jgi:hypothetical protein
MSKRDGLSSEDDRGDAPEKPTWRQRHGTELFIASFFLLTLLIVFYEMLSQ